MDMKDGADRTARIADYLAAAEAFAAAGAAVEGIARRLGRALQAVGPVSNTRGPRLFNGRNDNADIRATPDSAEILAVMGAWAEARMALRAAHAALAPGERAHVAPLPRDAAADGGHSATSTS